jgi:hypothetical protein
MEFIRRNISEVLADLPEICAAHLPSSRHFRSLVIFPEGADLVERRKRPRP